MEGSNVQEAFNRIAQNFLQLQSKLDLSVNLPSSIGGSDTPQNKKKFELNTKTTKKKRKCCV